MSAGSTKSVAPWFFPAVNQCARAFLMAFEKPPPFHVRRSTEVAARISVFASCLAVLSPYFSRKMSSRADSRPKCMRSSHLQTDHPPNRQTVYPPTHSRVYRGDIHSGVGRGGIHSGGGRKSKISKWSKSGSNACQMGPNGV